MTLERLDMCEGIIADQKMVFLINKLYENQIKLDVTRFLGQTEEKVRKARLGKVAENGEGIREIVLRLNTGVKRRSKCTRKLTKSGLPEALQARRDSFIIN